MTRSQPARIFYSAYNSKTGERVSGDASNHTFRYSSGTSWTVLSPAVTDLSEGVYTFILPAEYTDTETAVLLVTSSTYHVLIPAVELSFYEANVNITEASRDAIISGVADIPVAGGSTLSGTLSQQSAYLSGLTTDVTSMKTKFDGYPSGASVPVKTDIPSAASIVSQVLTSDVGAFQNPGEYSLTAMVLGGFSSVMNPQTGEWTISTPQGTPMFVRTFETSENMRPVVRVS